MNILYHHRTQGKTVEGVHIREVVKALRALGHTVFIVSPPGIDPFADIGMDDKQLKKQLVSRFLYWLSRHIPQFGFEIMEAGYNIIAYRNISKILKKQKIDLIYERYAFFNMAGVKAAKNHHIPIILEVNEVSGLARQRGQFFVKLAKRAERYIFEYADAIITVSTFLKGQLLAMNIDESKIRVLPNSVNIDEFDPAVNGETVRNELGLRGKTVLGFMGSFSVWDNLEFLIEAFSDIAGSYPQLALVLVGDGFNKQKLEEDARKKHMDEKIIFAGRVSHGRVPGYIAAMDIAIIPHSNLFGSPVVLFEYMAMAKPVIAPRLGPVSEVIEDRENGLLFEPGLASEMKRHIQELAVSSSARENIGARARETILARHLWKQNAGKIIDLFREIQ
jgi:glycosyltransferase involved in cell wall biosynthesis